MDATPTSVDRPADVDWAGADDASRRLRPFDFRNPSKMAREHVRRLELTHEVFARLFAGDLSDALRAEVRLELMSIDQVTYDEYIRSMPNPTVMIRITLAPLPGAAVVELSTQTGLTLVDRMLGGMGKPGLMRRLTELEGALLRDLMALALPALEATFEPLIEVTPKIEALEFNPNFLQVASPSEMVMVMSYSLSLVHGSRSEGLLTVTYPFSLLEPATELVTLKESDLPALEAGVPDDSPLTRTLPDVSVPISVRLRSSSVQAKELLGLREGDVLRLDHRVDEDVLGVVAGLVLIQGRIGRKGRNMALQLSNWRVG